MGKTPEKKSSGKKAPFGTTKGAFGKEGKGVKGTTAAFSAKLDERLLTSHLALANPHRSADRIRRNEGVKRSSTTRFASESKPIPANL